MAIVIDLADPCTDLKDARIVATQVDDDTLESLINLYRYGFGQQEKIKDKYIEQILEQNSNNNLLYETENITDVEDFREEVDIQRDRLNSQTGEAGEMLSNLSKICTYILTGENYTEASDAQQKAISHNWNMTINLPVETK